MSKESASDYKRLHKRPNISLKKQVAHRGVAAPLWVSRIHVEASRRFPRAVQYSAVQCCTAAAAATAAASAAAAAPAAMKMD